MNNIQIFQNPDFGQIRTLQIAGVPWFVGKDVAESLNYSNTRDALAKHVDPEDKNTVAIHDGIPGNPNLVIINESGLYALIFGSKLETAKKFKRWVTNEVLPALLHSGHYEMPGHGAAHDSISATLKLDQVIKDLKKSFGDTYASQIISGVCEHNGINTSEKIFLDTNKPKKYLPDNSMPDDLLHEYADQVQALGFQHKKGILVPIHVFNDFCSQNKISMRIFRRWLYQNGYIECQSGKNNKQEYAVTVWYDGGPKRFIVFT